MRKMILVDISSLYRCKRMAVIALREWTAGELLRLWFLVHRQRLNSSLIERAPPGQERFGMIRDHGAILLSLALLLPHFNNFIQLVLHQVAFPFEVVLIASG